MTARILDGKRIAEDLLDNLKAQVDARIAAGRSAPGLAVVLVGNDPASAVYVKNKRRAARKVSSSGSPGPAPTRLTCPAAPREPAQVCTSARSGPGVPIE